MKAGTWNTHCPGIKNPQDYVGFVQIPGFSDYLINTNGVVLSKQRRAWNGKVFHTLRGRVLTPVKAAQMGYWKVTLRKDKCSFQRYVHRLVAETFITKVDGSDVVNHKDANITNNNVSNLEWCTAYENVSHTKRLGRVPSGENHYGAKLSKDDIVDIKNMYNKENVTMQSIATRFHICVDSISKIIRGKSYV